MKILLWIVTLGFMAGGALAQGTGGAAGGSADVPATVVDVASSNPDFSTLTVALLQADLVDVLSGEGPFTVFAPTNEAFAALLEALNITPEELFARGDLSDILTYHVVPGKLDAEDVTAEVEAGGGTVALGTANSTAINVAVMDDEIVINDSARVIAADIEAGNGVVHVIDVVLVPPLE